MTVWAGLVMFALGAWLVGNALVRRRRQRVAPVRAELAGFGAIMRSVIIGALVLIGVKVTLMYLAFGGDGLFSGFNLAGLEFLLASYGVWVFITLAPHSAGSHGGEIEPAGRG